MKNDVLGEVIEAEREIQRSLEREAKKAREWLDTVKGEIEKELERAERELRENDERLAGTSGRTAELRAEEIIKKAGERAELIRATSDGVLREIARKHIRKILPE